MALDVPSGAPRNLGPSCVPQLIMPAIAFDRFHRYADLTQILIRRDPVETGGTYYRLLPEGRFDHYDGFTLRIKKRQQWIDLNRNFPGRWRQEFEQVGTGPYPTSEPEVRAVVDFIVRHTNLTGGTTFHTWSGVPLRPFEHLSDREEKGQLEGKAYKHTGVSFWPDYHVTDDRMKLEWVVKAAAGTTVQVVARHARAGTVRAAVTLA